MNRQTKNKRLLLGLVIANVLTLVGSAWFWFGPLPMVRQDGSAAGSDRDETRSLTDTLQRLLNDYETEAARNNALRGNDHRTGYEPLVDSVRQVLSAPIDAPARKRREAAMNGFTDKMEEALRELRRENQHLREENRRLTHRINDQVMH